MRPLLVFTTLSLITTACQGPDTASARDSLLAQQDIDTPPPAPRPGATRLDSAKGTGDGSQASTDGKEPGTIPATPTPTVTSESSIAAMRLLLQRLDSASARNLQGAMPDYARKLGDLMTTMEVEAQAATNPARTSWLALSDSVDGDLKRLHTAQGEGLRTAFRAHRLRVTRLLDGFRSIVPGTTP